MHPRPGLRPHDHVFGQDRKRPGERRTLVVIAVSGVMMAAEIAAGLAFGSMALLADGLHMASHASALTVTAFAYHYTRRHARDPRFNFGTGKVNSLAGFASAVLLVGFAFIMAWESFWRIMRPVAIGFDQAILVAVLGLAVNAVCLLILGGGHGHEHHGDAGGEHADHGQHGDHNLWSAYLHVLADAATSVLAIFALLGAKHLGLAWMDPAMGVVGAVLVTRWSWELLRSAARVLLDMQAPEAVRNEIRGAVEAVDGSRVTDLHMWSVGPGIFAAEIGIVSAGSLDSEGYSRMLPSHFGLVHVTIDVRRRDAVVRGS